MKHLRTAVLYTIISAMFLGIGYPLVITAFAQLIFPKQANGSLIVRNGQIIGSQLIGQTFSGPAYFHSRPSAAGKGYDAADSETMRAGDVKWLCPMQYGKQSSTEGEEPR